MRLKDGWHPYCYIFGMTHTAKLCNMACLEIKWKMASFFLVGVKTTIHLFTYSLSGIKIKKWTTFFCSELKHLFTYSPIHLLARRFRRIEPKGCRSVYGRQNWAYATKGCHPRCYNFWLNYRIAICVPHKDPATPSFLTNSAGTQ